MTTPDVDENGVNKRIKLILGGFFLFLIGIDIVVAFSDGTSAERVGTILGSSSVSWIGLAIGWFWLGPYLAKYAGNYNRNKDWGFIFGSTLNLVGVVIYWIYIWIVGVKDDN